MKILAIDDSKTLLLLLKSIIERLGHEFVFSNDPKEGIRLFQSEKPDLIILDVEISEEMDGYECARQIRRVSAEGEWIPIIFLSGMVNDENIAAGIDAGGDDYLTKPFSEITLKAKIKAMQRIADMRRELMHFSDIVKKSNQKLYELTYIDGLTGVSNRRAFDKGLVREWNKICRLNKSGEPFSLIMIDIDKFKFFNDHYGHQAGDECLQKVSQVLKEHLRRVVEMLCRYGGEEFVVLLPSIGKDEAMKIAETLRKSIQDIGIAHAD